MRNFRDELGIAVVEVWCGEPQPQQIALAPGLVPILVGGARVEDHRVLEELVRAIRSLSGWRDPRSTLSSWAGVRSSRLQRVISGPLRLGLRGEDFPFDQSWLIVNGSREFDVRRISRSDRPRCSTVTDVRTTNR